jgi:4-hydroxyacetophenone monooxygenase
MSNSSEAPGSPPLPPEHLPDVLDTLLADTGRLEARLMELDDVPLLLVYTHLTGDETLLQAYAPHIKGAWAFEVDEVPELKLRLCQALIATFADYAAAGRPLPPAPPPDLLQRMCNGAVGAQVPAEYMPMVREELNFDRTDAKTVRWRKLPAKAFLDAYKVVVIGAGYSGLAMADKLNQAGIPFVLIEKNPDVGGTWFENTYPGVAVDTPNHFYSYSFRVKPDWDHYFARGDEILDYIRTCYREMHIAEHMRFEEEVVSAIWDKAGHRWDVTVRRKDGSEYAIRANAVVTACGLLNRPSIPDIPGMDRFEGPMFHSAR